MHQVIPIPRYEKPRIKLLLPRTGFKWACASPGGAGFGETPEAAYRRWDFMREPEQSSGLFAALELNRALVRW